MPESNPCRDEQDTNHIRAASNDAHGAAALMPYLAHHTRVPFRLEKRHEG